MGKRGKYTFTVLLDKKTEVIPLYNPDQTLPYNALVDREGNLVWTKLSYAPGEEKLLREKIEEQLHKGKKEKSKVTPPTPQPNIPLEQESAEEPEQGCSLLPVETTALNQVKNQVKKKTKHQKKQ